MGVFLIAFFITGIIFFAIKGVGNIDSIVSGIQITLAVIETNPILKMGIFFFIIVILTILTLKVLLSNKKEE